MHWNGFQSYLEGRTTSVKVNNSRSSPDVMKYGVPQGSVLGPTLFNVYRRPLGDVMLKYGISYHMYADDSQLYIDFNSCDEETAMANLQLCIQELYIVTTNVTELLHGLETTFFS